MGANGKIRKHSPREDIWGRQVIVARDEASALPLTMARNIFYRTDKF